MFARYALIVVVAFLIHVWVIVYMQTFVIPSCVLYTVRGNS